MKPLAWIGMVLLALGLASLVVTIPHNDKQGITAGGMSVGMTVRHDEKVSPVISAVMILGGASLLIAGKARN